MSKGEEITTSPATPGAGPAGMEELRDSGGTTVSSVQGAAQPVPAPALASSAAARIYRDTAAPSPLRELSR